jgi:uncharacterized protein YqcC (DUF446 family)
MEARQTLDAFDKREWVEWAGKLLMPRMYDIVSVEQEVANEQEIAKMIKEIDDKRDADRKARFDVWQAGKKRELQSLIAAYQAREFGLEEYVKREEEVEAELKKTVEEFEPFEDDDELKSLEDEDEGEEELEIVEPKVATRSSKTGKVVPPAVAKKNRDSIAAMSAKKTVATKKTTVTKKSELSMDGFTEAEPSKVVR